MHTLQQIRSGELDGATHIRISSGLSEFPVELYAFTETLETLDLSMNRLSSLPKDFHRFTKLKIIFCSDNLFTELPPVLGKCERLEMIGFKSNQINLVSEESLPVNTRWLILTNNRIEKLPSTIGKCWRLQKVALAGNLLKELPNEMSQCKNLELLRISANRLEALPEWLLQLPKLSWLAFSGNVFNARHAEPKPLQEINWNEFTILEQLGEGASGNIYKALWHKNNEDKEVAIKVFKGEVTSDGFPQDEMQATIAAGKHENLVGLLGSIREHPQQKMGLVMELIPSTYKNLGLPPSLISCTRDTFVDGTQFSSEEIWKIALQIADAANQLHLRGLMHGDLYAHNILINKENHCLMGDFGAASFYDLNSTLALDLERIELRAFACLLDDLLTHLKEDEEDLALKFKMEQLRNIILSGEILKRPHFFEMIESLQRMKS